MTTLQPQYIAARDYQAKPSLQKAIRLRTFPSIIMLQRKGGSVLSQSKGIVLD